VIGRGMWIRAGSLNARPVPCSFSFHLLPFLSLASIRRAGASLYVSDLLSLRVESFFNELVERPAPIEQVRFDLQSVHEPFLESRLGFQAAVFPDVLN